jgi:hypothetical protein
MVSATLSTKTEIKGFKSPTAKLATFEIESSATVAGWKLVAVAAPSTPALSKSGIAKPSSSEVELNAEASKDGLTIFFDNLQLLPKRQFGPRVKSSTKHALGSGGYKVGVDATFIARGNTSEGKAKTPAPTEVLKLTLKPDSIRGFTPKMDYSTAKNVAALEVKTNVDRFLVTMKGEYDLKSKALGNASASASTTVKLPEDVKARIEVKSDASGKVELMKGRLTVDVPIKKGFKPPSVDDIALKIKFEQSLA